MPAYRINNKNVLFIHVPKTGGTSIEAYLSAHSGMSLHNRLKRLFSVKDALRLYWHVPMQHFHAGILERMFAPDFFDYVFMVVRDPLERLKSEYRHARALPFRFDTWLPFGAWARLMLSLQRLIPSLANNHLRPQGEFVCFDAEVFRFEDGIEHVLKTVSERLGLPAPDEIPHKRKLTGKDIAVSARAAAAVRAACRADYETFGYDMAPAKQGPSPVAEAQGQP